MSNSPEQQQQLQELANRMREESRLRPKANGRYFDNGCSCALGAVLEAASLIFTIPDKDDLIFGFQAAAYKLYLTDKFPVLKEQVYQAGGPEVALFSAIIAKNDHMDWTREQIADWLPTVELVQVDN